jgi:replicative DNA helicase
MEPEIHDAFVSAQTLVHIAKRIIEENAHRGKLCGVETGFHVLDKITAGWQPSDLIIIAGRTGMGKSAFALSMIRNAACDFGTPVALFSPEMSAVQVMNRFISAETGLDQSKLRIGKLETYESQKLAVKTKELEKAPIYIDDTPDLSIQKLSDRARKLVTENNVKMIVVDNIHLLSSGSSEKGIAREQEIGTILRGLKALAKELCIPILALSQLSREVENRGGYRRPILNDLRGSGTIEEIADIVSFLYRPEYYKIDEWDDEDQTPSCGQAEIIIAKHRNGTLENVRLKFIQSICKFDNLESPGFESGDLPIKKNHEDNPFTTKHLPNANEAFGSNMNTAADGDSDVPF